MYITQLSIFVENKFGRLSEILDVLAENQVDIRALSMADTSEFGILRMIVDDVEKAKVVLAESGVVVKSTEVIALPIDETPGGLARMVSKLRDAQISIEDLYAFFSRELGGPQVVMRVDDVKRAEAVLAPKN